MSRIDPELDAALTQAMLLARSGDRGSSESCISELRRCFDVNASPSAAIRVMLAEGVVSAYAGDSPAARDRFTRALALCGLARDQGLTALAHAWLAFVDYFDVRVPEFARNAFASVRLGKATSAAAMARGASLLGTAYVRSGDPTSGSGWFAVARRAASSDGDGQMTSIIIFNMAATRLNAARVECVCGPNPVEVDRADLLFLQSSSNYDASAGLGLQAYLHPMLQGLAQSVIGDFKSALGSLHRFEGQSAPSAWTADAVVPAEIAWCKLRCGLTDHALEYARRAEAGLAHMVDFGEEAIVRMRLASVYRDLGFTAKAELHLGQQSVAIGKFREFQAELRDQMNYYRISPND